MINSILVEVQSERALMLQHFHDLVLGIRGQSILEKISDGTGETTREVMDKQRTEVFLMKKSITREK